MISALLSLLLAASAHSAWASTLTVTGLGFGEQVPLYINAVTNSPNPGTNENEYAYQIKVTIDGIPAIAMCVDLFTNISYATYNTDAMPVNTMTWGPRVTWLYENFGRFAVTSEQAAAVQIAIWDIVHDGGDGLAAGNIQAQATTRTSLVNAANGFVTSSVGQVGTHAFLYHNVSLSTGAPAQTLIALASPEPATFGFAGVTLIALGLLRRRQ
ncbi:MAG: hypothetical protein JNK87_08430 [Bryobacterales bacterium]|nr:hypothetical protein [Bryobacterales bacterium]